MVEFRLRSGSGRRKSGAFSHETALVLHGLSDALPSKKHITVPVAWSKRRLRIPEGVVLHHADLGKSDVTWKGPVQVTTQLRTIFDCTSNAVVPDLVQQAITQGVRRGLFSKDDVKQIVRKTPMRRIRNGKS